MAGTGEYKLHYFETATQLKFVMLTDPRVGNMRTVLHQIWATLFVEFVVKSPLAPAEHTGGKGVANELFEGGLERFIVRLLDLHSGRGHANRLLRKLCSVHSSRKMQL